MLTNESVPDFEMEWILPTLASNAVNKLADQLRVSSVVARILASRGITRRENWPGIPSASRYALLDPMLLQDLDVAVERIARAITSGERILAYGDYDVDGTCSLAILKRALELLGGTVDFHVPHRLQEGYGLREEVIAQAAARGVSLIVTVDTGIRAQEAILHARTLGIDVIVTDHHLPELKLPDATAVVNPNRPDCIYPNKDLCGAGVIFKLIQALLRRSALPAKRQDRLLDSFLKAVAIATIADVVPLLGENRAIVARGLAALKTIRNPGLNALFSVAGLIPGEVPTAHQIAFRVAPRINAAGRMQSARAVVELLLTEDCAVAHDLAQKLDHWNTERRRVECEIVERILGSHDIAPGAQGLVFAVPSSHLGVLGIVASRLVERFHAPVIVVTDDPREPGTLAGSGRSIPEFHLLEALDEMADLFIAYGGHRQAAGVRLRSKRLDEFRSRFAEYASQRLGNEQRIPQHYVDAEVSFSDLTAEVAEGIQSLGPFGWGIPYLCAG